MYSSGKSQNNIGNKIRDFRMEKGFSQKDLAYYCKTDESVIRKIENGIAANAVISPFVGIYNDGSYLILF